MPEGVDDILVREDAVGGGEAPELDSIGDRNTALRERTRCERASGKRAEATHQLLEIVKRDRKWNEDGARKQLVQFFEAWGPTEEATVEGRKRLSTILFSCTISINRDRKCRSMPNTADPANCPR